MALLRRHLWATQGAMALALMSCKSENLGAPVDNRQPAQLPGQVGPTAASSTPRPNFPGSSSTTTTRTSFGTVSSITSTTLGAANFLTQGSGGPVGRREIRSRNGNYWINVPQTNPVPNQGLGLLVALHGSSASSYAQFATEMAPIAQSYGMMIASVLAPNGSGWNEGNQQSNAQYLHNLIQNEIYRLYNIDTRKVIFSGQSSGGGFLGSHFIPLFGENYQGGAFLQCGVQPPFRAFTASARMQQSFQIHIEITTGETIWRQFFNPAIQSYQQAGLQVSSRSDRPGGHCQFSQSEVIQSQIRRFLPAL